MAVYRVQPAADIEYIARHRPGNGWICMVVLSIVRETLHEKGSAKEFRTTNRGTGSGVQFVNRRRRSVTAAGRRL